jgi:DNA-binding transcriptional MerR regulator
MLYSIGKFAKEIGLSTKTLRNWHRDKQLIPAKVTPGGTRYYSDKQLEEYLNGDKDVKGI